MLIDTDVAADDWMAILYLLRHPRISVTAITVTGTGEAHSDPGARNTLGLLALAGRCDVPVAMGSETPLGFGHVFPDAIREMVDRVMDIALPAHELQPSRQDAVALLTTCLQEQHEKVVILALGPLTNLASAFQQTPSLVDRVEMLYVMGGAVDVPGNVLESGFAPQKSVAEWNIYCDPQAAKLVFHSGAPITLVPLDATNQVPVTAAFLRNMEQKCLSPEANFVHEVLRRSEDYIAAARMYFWDPLAAAILTDPTLATFEDRSLTVLADDRDQNGRTLESATGARIHVCVGVDRHRFEKMFLDGLNGQLVQQ